MNEDSTSALRVGLLRWEKFRLWYNGIMLAFGLFLSYGLKEDMQENEEFGYWGNVFLYGLIANAFFSLGPLLESYLIAFRRKPMNARGRRLLFTLGLGFSLVGSFALCIGYSFRYFRM